MPRPVIGIVGNHYLIDEQYPVQATGEMNINAVSELCDAIPMVVPSLPEADLMFILASMDMKKPQPMDFLI